MGWGWKSPKYKNKKVITTDGKFDSQLEYYRWCELQILEKAKKIKDLKRQVKFVLIPTQREPNIMGRRGGIKKGKLLERECAYIADFVYFNENGKMVVEDAKGKRTDDYIIKRKLMLYIHNIVITEILNGKD